MGWALMFVVIGLFIGMLGKQRLTLNGYVEITISVASAFEVRR